ncbi:MAG: hypothetical protein HDT18_02145 [Oscillibacter sp.]|nr:hypothetical protein [Oscillibacter sp.]
MIWAHALPMGRGVGLFVRFSPEVDQTAATNPGRFRVYDGRVCANILKQTLRSRNHTRSSV